MKHLTAKCQSCSWTQKSKGGIGGDNELSADAREHVTNEHHRAIDFDYWLESYTQARRRSKAAVEGISDTVADAVLGPGAVSKRFIACKRCGKATRNASKVCAKCENNT